MSGGITPGFHSEAHRAAFFTARDRLLASGGALRCSALAKHGGRCGAFALRGHAHCPHHAPVTVQRERRLRLLRQPVTAAQAERARRREAARLQRIAWKADRWAPGATVTLGPREDEFQGLMRTIGFLPETFSPATADAARWCWLNMTAGRMTTDHLRLRVQWHVLRD